MQRHGFDIDHHVLVRRRVSGDRDRLCLDNTAASKVHHDTRSNIGSGKRYSFIFISMSNQMQRANSPSTRFMTISCLQPCNLTTEPSRISERDVIIFSMVHLLRHLMKRGTAPSDCDTVWEAAHFAISPYVVDRISEQQRFCQPLDDRELVLPFDANAVLARPIKF